MTTRLSVIFAFSLLAFSGCTGQTPPVSSSSMESGAATQAVTPPSINDVPMSASGIDFATESNDPIATEKMLPTQPEESETGTVLTSSGTGTTASGEVRTDSGSMGKGE